MITLCSTSIQVALFWPNARRRDKEPRSISAGFPGTLVLKCHAASLFVGFLYPYAKGSWPFLILCYYASMDHPVMLMQTLQHAERRKRNANQAIDVLYQQWQLTAKREQTVSKWNEKIAKFTDENDQQKDDLQTRHDEELDAFIERWKDPNVRPPFSKPSPMLIQLREQKRAMAVNRMYTVWAGQRNASRCRQTSEGRDGYPNEQTSNQTRTRSESRESNFNLRAMETQKIKELKFRADNISHRPNESQERDAGTSACSCCKEERDCS
jgi:hypothetical protein